MNKRRLLRKRPLQKYRGDVLQIRVFWPERHSVDQPKIRRNKLGKAIQCRHYRYHQGGIPNETRKRRRGRIDNRDKGKHAL